MPDTPQTTQTTPIQTTDPSLPRSQEAFTAQKEGEAQWAQNFGSPLERAYGHAKAWLGEHEDKIDEKYLKPFRQGLDNMADDLQNAAETGRTKGGVPLTGPTKALAEGAAAGLRMVPIGKTTKETAQALIAPPELKEEGLAKKLVEGEGLIYKGEVSPGTGIHMIEHPDHPGVTSTFRGEMTPENVHKNMERKVKEFGKEYVPPSKEIQPAITHEPGKINVVKLADDTGKNQGMVKYTIGANKEAMVTAANIEPSMRGKGHGVAMYERAAAEAKKQGATGITSDLAGTDSMDSARVWESLMKKHPDEIQKVPSKPGSPGYRWTFKNEKTSSLSDKAKKAANAAGSKEL